MFDWTINFGNIVTVIAFLVGGISFMTSIRSRVDDMSGRMLSMENELSKMVSILVQQGRHDERMTAMDHRIAAQGQRLDDMIRRFNNNHGGD